MNDGVHLIVTSRYPSILLDGLMGSNHPLHSFLEIVSISGWRLAGEIYSRNEHIAAMHYIMKLPCLTAGVPISGSARLHIEFKLRSWRGRGTVAQTWSRLPMASPPFPRSRVRQLLNV